MRRAYILAFVLAGLGCRKEVTIDGQNVAHNKELLARGPAVSAPAPSPHAVPVQLPGALGTPRSYAQTRGSFSLTVASAALAGGTSLTLADQTTKATLLEQAVTVDAPLSLAIYPLDPAIQGKLAYGDNQLHLLVDEASPIADDATVHLRDFTVFAPATAAFASGAQRSGGLQGGFSIWGKDLLTGSGGSTLSVGFVPQVNE